MTRDSEERRNGEDPQGAECEARPNGAEGNRPDSIAHKQLIERLTVLLAKATPGPWEKSLEAARFVIQHTPDHGMGKRAIAYTGGAEPASGFDASRFDPGRESCPHCGYIEEACDCDLHQYMGAFDEPHFTGATR